MLGIGVIRLCFGLGVQFEASFLRRLEGREPGVRVEAVSACSNLFAPVVFGAPRNPFKHHEIRMAYAEDAIRVCN